MPDMNVETSPPPLWIEVALNGGWGTVAQPLIPTQVSDVVRQGVACIREGASIVHFHAYDDMNHPCDDLDFYIAVIEGIRGVVDAIVYPTIAFDGDDRYLVIEQLAKRGLLEWCTLDTGSVNLGSFADIASGKSGTVYLNDEKTIRRGLKLARDHRFHPSFACYEPGFIRMGAALTRAVGSVPDPIYRLMFSDTWAFGFPPTLYAIESYRRLLASEVPEAQLMIAGLGVDLEPITSVALSYGMHLRVGLEDCPLGSSKGNVELVEAAVRQNSGRRALATAADVRSRLG